MGKVNEIRLHCRFTKKRLHTLREIGSSPRTLSIASINKSRTRAPIEPYLFDSDIALQFKISQSATTAKIEIEFHNCDTVLKIKLRLLHQFHSTIIETVCTQTLLRWSDANISEIASELQLTITKFIYALSEMTTKLIWKTILAIWMWLAIRHGWKSVTIEVMSTILATAANYTLDQIPKPAPSNTMATTA